MPLESVHRRIPIPGTLSSATMRPGAGGDATSAPSATVSTHGVTATVAASASTARSCASEGTASPAFSGSVTVTTRLRDGCRAPPSVPSRRMAAFTSASVMAGSSRCTAAYSHAIPGMGAPVRKWSTYSSTKPSDGDLSRSSHARS
jgi:hypothetical protein